MRGQHLLSLTFRNILLGGIVGAVLGILFAGSGALSNGLLLGIILGVIAGLLASAISVWLMTLREGSHSVVDEERRNE